MRLKHQPYERKESMKEIIDLDRVLNRHLSYFSVSNEKSVSDIGQLPRFSLYPLSQLKLRRDTIKQRFDASFFVSWVCQGFQPFPRVP